jgi:hypothetical protein
MLTRLMEKLMNGPSGFETRLTAEEGRRKRALDAGWALHGSRLLAAQTFFFVHLLQTDPFSV